MIKYFYIILLISFPSLIVFGQSKEYTVANAHSHNDYLQKRPFTSAFQAGFGSMEADIFPVNDDLLVAHSEKEIKPDRSLRKLYLKPLGKHLRQHRQELQLLIDIKRDTETSMELLIKLLKPLKKYLSTPIEKKRLRIVMTGQIPSPEDYDNYPNYIYYDHDLKRDLTDEQWHRVAMVSVNFKSYSRWKDEGLPVDSELTKLQRVVARAGEKGKPFRFWGAPDRPDSWILQQRLGVDWIGTDHIEQLSSFLRAL